MLKYVYAVILSIALVACAPYPEGPPIEPPTCASSVAETYSYFYTEMRSTSEAAARLTETHVRDCATRRTETY